MIVTFPSPQLPICPIHSHVDVPQGWSLLGYVQDSDIKAVAMLAEVPANMVEEDLAVDWDFIVDRPVCYIMCGICNIHPSCQTCQTHQNPPNPQPMTWG